MSASVKGLRLETLERPPEESVREFRPTSQDLITKSQDGMFQIARNVSTKQLIDVFRSSNSHLTLAQDEGNDVPFFLM
jgi:hypothetical protein